MVVVARRGSPGVNGRWRAAVLYDSLAGWSSTDDPQEGGALLPVTKGESVAAQYGVLPPSRSEALEPPGLGLLAGESLQNKEEPATASGGDQPGVFEVAADEVLAIEEVPAELKGDPWAAPNGDAAAP